MVTAGFPAAVAPLGTALTEDQLGLLWKMADEPVLCFDGDKAGVRAAYRAVDIAMPRLKPGKSLKFALLPEGQDPDDLLRSAGREAVADVIDAAQAARVDAVGARDRRPSVRHAGAARGAGGAHQRGHHHHRATSRCARYYRQDFADRLRQFFAPPAASGPRAVFRWQERRPGQARGQRRRRRRAVAAARPATPAPASGRPMPYVVVSQQLAASSAASRPSHGGAPARGAHPAGGAQPPLAAARPPGGAGAAGIPASGRRAAEKRADRHRGPRRRSLDAETLRAELAQRGLSRR